MKLTKPWKKINDGWYEAFIGPVRLICTQQFYSNSWYGKMYCHTILPSMCKRTSPYKRQRIEMAMRDAERLAANFIQDTIEGAALIKEEFNQLLEQTNA